MSPPAVLKATAIPPSTWCRKGPCAWAGRSYDPYPADVRSPPPQLRMTTTTRPPQPRHQRWRRTSTRCDGHGEVPNFTFPLALLLLVVSLVCSAEAQSPPGSNSPGPYPGLSGRFNPSMAIIIVVLISAFFFMGFFSIYVRQCSERADLSIRADGGGGGAGGRRSRRSAARGLDPAVIQTFPTLVYADVKEHKIGKGALECAVCLSEFDDEDNLRLLPKCDHVFHPDCIDAWLAAHTTCPVCRAQLAPDPNDPAVTSAPDTATALSAPGVNAGAALTSTADGAGADQLPSEVSERTPVEAVSQSDQVAITIEVAAPQDPVQLQRRADTPPLSPAAGRMARVENKPRQPWRSKSFVRPLRFPRSHSTGHSMTVVQSGEDCDRYTLRLPDNIRRDIMAGKLQRSSSCATAHAGGDGTTRKGYGGGGSSVGGRSFKLRRWEWVAKSDRWSIFARTFSMKTSRGDGSAEGSTRRGEGSTRRGLDGGTDAAGEGSFKAKMFPVVKSPFDCLGTRAGVSVARAAPEEGETSTKAPETGKV